MLEAATVVAMVIEVELMVRSDEDVPTVPSMMFVVPSLFWSRNQAAVPVAAALVSDVMALAVSVWTVLAVPDGPVKAVAFIVSVANRVCAPTAVSPSVGCDPE